VLGDRVRRLPFLPWVELPEVLRDLDLNLAPLEPGSRFNDAKSAIKWLEAALVGTPTIASPSAPFVEAIHEGRTGWLADTPEQWVGALDRALGDAHDRRAVGEQARRAALMRWSPHLQADRYLRILEHLVGAPGPRRAPSAAWVPVALDEPWLPDRVPLEPYPAPVGDATIPTAPPPPPPGVADRVRAKLDLATERLREEGPVATAAATGRWVRRRVSRRGRGDG
jgi:hypothetical protein